MTVVKLNDQESSQSLEWDPKFPDGGTLPADTSDMPAEIQNLTVSDMREGLNSEKFAKRATFMRDKFCGMMHEAIDPATGAEQKRARHRWTVHPDVDGCEEPPEPPH